MVFRSIGYHLTSHRNVSSSEGETRVQVRGGYNPDTIHWRAGVPIRIVFHRDESAPCSEQVVFPAFGKSATLPQGEDVAVHLLPEEPGEYEFTCAMGMLRGRLIVSPAITGPATRALTDGPERL